MFGFFPHTTKAHSGEDFEADEAGLLPKDLKRGVLSEDAVYGLLSDYDALEKQLLELSQID